MIKNFDGVYLNPRYVSLIAPESKATTYKDYYKIKFIISPDTFYGQTEFKSEKDCRDAIERMLNDFQDS